MATTTLAAQISITFSPSTILPNQLRKHRHPTTDFKYYSTAASSSSSSSCHVPSCCKLSIHDHQNLKGIVFRSGFLVETNGLKRNCKRRAAVLISSNNLGVGFNGGGGGNGGGDDDGTATLVRNVALAIGFTYLSLTGQLGWILDAIVSIGIAIIVVPILGVVAFLWWAGRDIVRGNCPNCGNDIQFFKASLNDESHQCPYCGEPFSIVGDEFVSDTNQSTTFGQAFDDLFPRSNKGSEKEKKYSKAIVDIEAEVKDAD